MPDPTTPEPPAVEIDADSFSSALAASAPQIGNPPGAAPPAPVVEAPVPSPAADTKPTEPAKKPEGEKPKKGLDALPEEKTEEGKKPEGEKPKEDPLLADDPEVDTSKWNKAQQEAFASARVQAKRLKEQVRETQIRAEKLQKELEQAKANPKDSEKTVQELEELRTWRKAQELKTTPEWADTFEKPLQQSLARLSKIAERARVDPEKLQAATDVEDELDRYDAIAAVFENADAPVPAHLVAAALDEAKKMHPLYERAIKMQKDAAETLSSLKHQTEQQKAEAEKAAEAEYAKHHEHIYGQLAKKLPSLFKDEAFAAEVKAARPGTDPADRAFEVQAAAALPKLASELFALREELAKEKASKAALLGARPGVTPTAPSSVKPASADDVELDADGFDSAMKTMGRR